MTNPVLNMQSPLVVVKGPDGKEIGKGYIISPWNSFFQQSVQQAVEVASIAVGASPFSYTPNANGKVIISGGTVSAISLIRGRVSIPLSTVRPLIVPMDIGDTIQVTYTVLPTIQFLGD